MDKRFVKKCNVCFLLSIVILFVICGGTFVWAETFSQIAMSEKQFVSNVDLNENDRIDLSDTQKAEYYEEYCRLAEKVSAETGNKVEVVPLQEFNDEDWVTLEAFEKRLYSVAAMEFVASEDGDSILEDLESQYLSYIPDTSPGVKADKLKEVRGRDIDSVELKVEGEFKTQLAFEIGRQMFSGIILIDSTKVNGMGEWTQTGYSYQVLDGGRTYAVTVEGEYEINGNVLPVRETVEFYCSAVGRIS